MVSILKLVIYFVSGLFIIGGAACLGLGIHNGSVQALGAAIMFLCFGVAGLLLGIYLEPIMRALRQNQRAT